MATARRRVKAHLTHGRLSPLLIDGIRPLLIAGDLAACVAGVLLVGVPLWMGVLQAVFLLTMFGEAGLYRSRLALSVLDQLPQIFRRCLLALAVLLVVSELLLPDVEDGMSVTAFAATTGLIIVAVRAVSYAAVRHLRRIGWVRHETIVIGADEVGNDIAGRIMAHPESGLSAAGFLDSRPYKVSDLSVPLLGGPDDLATVLDRHQPKVLIFAQGGMDETQLVSMVRACHRSECEVLVLPRMHEIASVGDDTDFIGDLPLVRLRRQAYRTWGWRWKRVLDIAVSALAIVLLSPVLLACALAVRLEGGRGVIFRQERVGCDGRPFQLLKFRSLRPVDDTEAKTHWNISHDDRLGRVGRFLRVTSLDELPQLFNILRGDMSLVGPRPERPFFVAEFDQLYRGYNARHRVPSGLTGWAQVNGLRGDTSIAERARFDNFYIENWSLWLDIKIILRTVVSVFKSPGS